jgi:hypothetical protein
MDIVMLIKAVGNVFIAAIIFIAMFISAFLYVLLVVVVQPKKRLAFLSKKIILQRDSKLFRIKKLAFASKGTQVVR